MVKGKALVGPILGVIGATLLTVAGFIGFGLMATLQALLATYGLTWADVGLDPSLLNVSAILTLVWGLLGLIGAILAFLGKKIGVYLMLIFGLIATVGMFIPIGTYTILLTVEDNEGAISTDEVIITVSNRPVYNGGGGGGGSIGGHSAASGGFIQIAVKPKSFI